MGGMISYVGLDSWWISDLTQSDRHKIQEGYAPLGSNNELIDCGLVVEILGNNGKPVTQLRVLYDLLNASCPYEVKEKIIKKGFSIASDCDNPLDMHFFFGQVITVEYQQRSGDETAVGRTIIACKAQIAVASKAKARFKKSSLTQGLMPSHLGYKQLSIILEKQGKFKEVVKLCEKARKQGWRGDWDRRIEKCNKKIETLKSPTHRR